MKAINAALASAIVLLGLPAAVAAAPVKWDVDYTNSNANLTVMGSFVFDADLNSYSAVNLSATDAGNVSNTTYLFVSPFVVPNAMGAVFRNQENADRTLEKLLSFGTSQALTNAGGVISNASGAAFLFQALVCTNSDCSATSGLSVIDESSSSTLTGTPVTTGAVPLPASLPLLLGGLLGLVTMRRRVRA